MLFGQTLSRSEAPEAPSSNVRIEHCETGITSHPDPPVRRFVYGVHESRRKALVVCESPADPPLSVRTVSCQLDDTLRGGDPHVPAAQYVERPDAADFRGTRHLPETPILRRSVQKSVPEVAHEPELGWAAGQSVDGPWVGSVSAVDDDS